MRSTILVCLALYAGLANASGSMTRAEAGRAGMQLYRFGHNDAALKYLVPALEGRNLPAKKPSLVIAPKSTGLLPIQRWARVVATIYFDHAQYGRSVRIMQRFAGARALARWRCRIGEQHRYFAYVRRCYAKQGEPLKQQRAIREQSLDAALGR